MKSKRLLSLLLSLLMLVGMIPTSVFADEVNTTDFDEIIAEVTEDAAVEETAEDVKAEAPEEAIEEVAAEEAPVLNEKDSVGHNLITKLLDSSTYPESEHNTRTSGLTTYDFSYPGATMFEITFTPESNIYMYEYLWFENFDGDYLGGIDSTELPGGDIRIYGNNFRIMLQSEGYYDTYGFKIESIVATVPEHTGKTAGSSLPATCTEDGYKAGFICDLCHEDIHGDVLPAIGHNYVEEVVAPTEKEFGYSLFTCTNCGDSYKGKFRGYGPHYQDDIHDTMSWIIEDGVLYILGTGEMPDGWINYNNWIDQEGVTSVVISEGITYLGEGAFSSDDNITSIKIPSTVTRIGDMAFAGTTSLKSITLPEGLENISRSAFSDSGLTSITIPDSVQYIGQYAFSGCKDLAEVHFGSRVETIELQAFQNCTSLTSVYFPANIEYIAQSAFRYCSKLQEITFGESKARGGFGSGLYLGIEAFAYCDLREVDLPDTTYSIDGGTFTCNPKLTAVNVSTKQTMDGIQGPKYLTDDRGCVYEYAMNYNTKEYYKYNLVVIPGAISGSYKVPDCVTTIEAEIRDMPNLTSFSFGAGYGGILNSYAYLNCPKLVEVKAGGSGEGDEYWFNDKAGALLYKGHYGYVHIYFVPANATEYTIPADVVNIVSDGAFSNCKQLKNIYVAEGNEYMKSIDGVVYNLRGTTLWVYPAGRTNTVLRIPATVEDIDSAAFEGCSNITDIYFEGDFFWMDYSDIEVDALTIWYPAENKTWDPAMLDAMVQEYGIAYGIKLTFKPYGEEAEGIDPPRNVQVKIVESTGKPKITWNKVEGAVKYEVWRATTKTGKGSRLSTVTGTSLTNNNAVASKTYYYWVIAVDKDGKKSIASEKVSIVCDCAPPVVKVTTVTASGKPKLTWAKVEGAKSYDIYRATSKTGKYARLSGATVLNYTDKTAKPGTTYYYKVKALGVDSSANSIFSNVVSRLAKLATPTVTLSNVASTGKIKVSWTKVDGAAKYQVQRATSKNGTYSVVKTTTSLSYTDTNTTAGKTYYYKVRAVHTNTNANSAYTAYKSRMADLKAPVVKITTSSGKPKVSWAGITGAKEYKIYRATSKTGKYSPVKTTTAKYWKDTTAKKGKTYYYKVVAVHKNSSANSAYSNVVYKKCTR